jgi:1-pyrroline-5-carboxylate dehydrogenase
VVIAPFNFPLALSAGMSAGALLAGNTVVFKPSEDAPWTGYRLAEIYREAGLPPGAFNMLHGDGATGATLVNHPNVDGAVFTGSRAVGMKIFRQFTHKTVRPCIIEMGGKNPAIITASADVDVAAEGVMRSAFGLQGQKCSACSRVYVERKIKGRFLEHLLAKVQSLTIGDPSSREVYLGPLINQESLRRFRRAVSETQRDGGAILHGGEVLNGDRYRHGFFVTPTIVDGLPRSHRFFREELFLPFLTVAAVDSLEQAVHHANTGEYGLTAGIYCRSKKELRYFFDHIAAGVTYANRRSGATTGAWPGVQSFCGWKSSGSTGKGACGPYYVQQFMREQSRTVMR